MVKVNLVPTANNARLCNFLMNVTVGRSDIGDIGFDESKIRGMGSWPKLSLKKFGYTENQA